jgi:hypothetical protein
MHSVLYIQASSSLLSEPDPFGDDFEADLENDQEFGDRAERVYTHNTLYIQYACIILTNCLYYAACSAACTTISDICHGMFTAQQCACCASLCMLNGYEILEV